MKSEARPVMAERRHRTRLFFERLSLGRHQLETKGYGKRIARIPDIEADLVCLA